MTSFLNAIKKAYLMLRSARRVPLPGYPMMVAVGKMSP